MEQRSLNKLRGVKAIAFDGAYFEVRQRGDEKAVSHIISLPSGPVDFTPYAPLLDYFDVFPNGVYLASGQYARANDIRPVNDGATAAVPDFRPSRERVEENMLRVMVEKALKQQRKRDKERADRAALKAESKRVQKRAPEPVEEVVEQEEQGVGDEIAPNHLE